MLNQITVGRLSCVSMQLSMIPSSRSMLSRDKRLPLHTWNQSGLQEKVFGNQFSRFDSPRDILKEFNLTTCKETKKQSLKPEGRRLFTQVKTDEIKAQFQCRHLQQDRRLRVLQCRWNYRRTTWSDSKDSKYRNCNSTKSLVHNRFLVWKLRFKNQVTTCSDFPSDAMLWIKKVEMVDSLDERCWTRRSRGTKSPKGGPVPTRTTDRLHHLRLLSSDWRP